MKEKMSVAERSWILYDVANSAFVLIIVTALMPIYFKDVIAVSMDGYASTALWGYANSTASLVLAVLAPLLGALADYGGAKKRFFGFFFAVGLVFTLMLTLVQPGQWLFCLAVFILARIGWSGANIFYDAFLVDIASHERMDTVSTRGYGYGYVGSVVPFVIIIIIIFAAGMEQGISSGAIRLGFVIVALWWLLFALPAMRHLQPRYFLPAEISPVRQSLRRLWSTVRNLRRNRQVFLFLGAYFFYIDGVGTIIAMSTAYGRDLGFGVTLLIVVLLFIQLVAFPFALLYGWLAQRFGTKTMLFAGIGLYSLATFGAFFLPVVDDQAIQVALYWVLAFLIASSMGGIQALSRSYYGRLIPLEKSAEYYGFYNVFGKFAAISGPALMGAVSHVTGDSRWGILSILVLFLMGAILLARVEDR